MSERRTTILIPEDIYKYAKKNSIPIKRLVIEGYKSIINKDENLIKILRAIEEKLNNIEKKLEDLSKSLAR